MTFKLVHASYRRLFYIFVFVLTCSLPLVLFFVLSLCVLILILAPCLGKLELIGPLPLPLSLPLELSCLRMISVEKPMTLCTVGVKSGLGRSVVLDEIDPAIRANFECRGWLPFLEIDHPPPTALIREFYSNLSCHIYDSNTLVRSWIQGIEFTITPRVVAEAFRMPVVRDAVYPYDESPYDESPSLDVVMSYITGSSI